MINGIFCFDETWIPNIPFSLPYLPSKGDSIYFPVDFVKFNDGTPVESRSFDVFRIVWNIKETGITEVEIYLHK